MEWQKPCLSLKSRQDQSLASLLFHSADYFPSVRTSVFRGSLQPREMCVSVLRSGRWRRMGDCDEDWNPRCAVLCGRFLRPDLAL